MVQDESQGYHWNHDYCTMHPAVVFYKKDRKTCSKSFCFISDDLVRDVALVWKLQFEITNFSESNLPLINEIEYFTDEYFTEKH
jgi:hypothetical protein